MVRERGIEYSTSNNTRPPLSNESTEAEFWWRTYFNRRPVNSVEWAPVYMYSCRVCVCVLRGGGMGRGSRLYWLWFKAKWWSRHWTVTLNPWSWLIHPSLTTGRHLKGRALLFEKRSVEPGGVVNLSWGKGDCCGPVATDFTLLRLTCQIGEFSKSKSNLALLPAYKLDSFRF